MRRWLLPALLVGALLAPPLQARGPSLEVRAPVVAVEPLVRSEGVAEYEGDCDPPRPASADLVGLLAWDLAPDCRVAWRYEEIVTGYDVHYRWEGRTFTRRQAHPPGESVAVRLELQ